MPIQPKQQPPYYQQGTNIPIYNVLINQSSGDAPTTIVLKNTIGTIILTRLSTGTYTIEADEPFLETNTTVYIQDYNIPPGKILAYTYSDGKIYIETRNSMGLADGQLYNNNLIIQKF